MKRIITALAVFAICSCGTDNTKNHTNQDTLSDRITTAIVEKTNTSQSVTTSGIIRAIPSAYAEVSIPFPGRITKSYVKLGDSVRKGSPLFEISSPELFEAAKSHSQADQEMALAEKNLNRQKELFKGKMCSIRELEEAETAYNNAVKEHESSKAALEAYGIDPNNTSVGQPLSILSPVAGRVVKNSLVIGQYLKEDADPQVIVADLSKVWVVANVKERDLAHLSQDSQIAITLIAAPGKIFTGKLVNISELLDPETRAVEVIIECDNQDKSMKPNMYGTVTFTTSETGVIVVPNSAILQSEEGKYVFVKDGDSYRKALVSTYEAANDSSAIREGLKEGDEIIIKGAFYLTDKN